MARCMFVTDLHGKTGRYAKLFRSIISEKPEAVFLGGDILPNAFNLRMQENFITGFISSELSRVRDMLGELYPRVFVILGNDDERSEEESVNALESAGLWEYVNNRKTQFGRWNVFGYPFVPPTPFRLKDWERYDVSRYVDPGCTSPEDGIHTTQVSEDEIRYTTIQDDLSRLTGGEDLSNAILLFHSPPYRTKLDRAALDGSTVDHVPVDLHVGSIAIRRLIEERQPLLTLHGHVHESPRLTGSWRDQIGKTLLYSAAHDGPGLALIRIDLEDPSSATRELI